MRTGVGDSADYAHGAEMIWDLTNNGHVSRY